MNNEESENKKQANKIEKQIPEDSAADMTLGDKLLEKEFKRNEAAKQVLEKHKLDTLKSDQEE